MPAWPVTMRPGTRSDEGELHARRAELVPCWSTKDRYDWRSTSDSSLYPVPYRVAYSKTGGTLGIYQMRAGLRSASIRSSQPLRPGAESILAQIKLNHYAHLRPKLAGPDGPVQTDCQDCHRLTATSASWPYAMNAPKTVALDGAQA